MKLISFDIGIKNMAYCVFDISGSLITIIDWNVLNLLDSIEESKKVCSCLNKPKNKKTSAISCNKTAKYCKDSQNYCEKHAKTSGFLIPEKRFSSTALKKLKIEDLMNLCKECKIECLENLKKKEIFDIVSIFFQRMCLQPIIVKKEKKANEADLISIGKKMKMLLNNLVTIEDIDYAILENQISPIANRMKTVQGMLAQYFIMINENIHIEFISSSNKLKIEVPLAKTPSDSIEPMQENLENVFTASKNSYKQNKIDGITKCSQILEKNPGFFGWKHMLETKKKDDLADCFLQGHWYIHKKIIKS